MNLTQSPHPSVRSTVRTLRGDIPAWKRIVLAWTGAALAIASIVLAAPMAMADEIHSDWDQLLQSCVVPVNNGNSTAADYDCFDKERSELTSYLRQLSSVAEPSFNSWSKQDQLAFLINAYNAWTVELILSEWPNVESIKELGSFLRSPWKKNFIPLLGQSLSLDDIEHGMIREPGRFDDPRIHFAVNCASIGCPALRQEAYIGTKLNAQLDEQTRSFLSDRSRNRYAEGRLYLSSLFKWYEQDFEAGWRGATSLRGFIALYEDALALSSSAKQTLRRDELSIEFLDYDWQLNKP